MVTRLRSPFSNSSIISLNFSLTDGIDPDSSVNVTIQNSSIDVGDDGICFKSTAGYGPLQNILVKDCIVRSRSSAIKFGSGTEEHMTNITVDNVFIWDSNRGIGIQHRDNGSIWDVTLKNIVIDGVSYQPKRW